MRITHFMLTVSAVMFVWLTASYLRPVPSASYEHATTTFSLETSPITETSSTTLVKEIPVVEGTVIVK